MSAGLWFWLIFVLVIILSAFLYWPYPAEGLRMVGVSAVTFVLIGLLGWGIFGPPIK